MWVCPQCSRRVPPSQAQCRCGVGRPDTAAPSLPATANRNSKRLVIEAVVVIAAIGVAAVSYWQARANRSTSQPAPAAAPAATAAPAVVRAVAEPAPEPPPATPPTTTAPKPDPPPSIEDVVGRAMPAVVRVEAGSSFGSGFFVTP